MQTVAPFRMGDRDLLAPKMSRKVSLQYARIPRKARSSQKYKLSVQQRENVPQLEISINAQTSSRVVLAGFSIAAAKWWL